MDDRHLLAEITARLDRGEAVALATVIDVSGSAPQRPGAKMAVLAGGSAFGTVGGGCVEETVRAACRDALAGRGQPRLLDVSLTPATGTGEGDVCGGVMQILVEVLR